MSSSDRAALRNQPCKKQNSPFFSTSQDNNNSVDSNLSKPPVNSYEVLSSTSTTPVNPSLRQSSPNHHLDIKNKLRQAKHAIFTAKIQNTTKSMKVQKRLSTYFTSLARRNVPKAYDPPDEYLPAQSFFRLNSKIQKAAMSQSSRQQYQAEEPLSMPSPPIAPLGQRCSSPYRNPFPKQPTQDRLQEILDQDAASKQHSDASADTFLRSDQSSSSNDPNLSMHSEFSPTQKIGDTPIHRRVTRSAFLVGVSSRAPAPQQPDVDKTTQFEGKKDPPDQSPILNMQSINVDTRTREKHESISKTLSDAEIRDFLNMRTTPFQLDSSSSSSQTSPSFTHTGVPKGVRKELIKHSKVIKEMLQSLKSDAETYASLQSEYDQRGAYIQAQLSELSASSGSTKLLSMHSVPFRQPSSGSSLYSSEHPLIPSQVRFPPTYSTPSTKRKISKPFSLLRFAGNQSDDTYLTKTDIDTSDESLFRQYHEYKNQEHSLKQMSEQDHKEEVPLSDLSDDASSENFPPNSSLLCRNQTHNKSNTSISDSTSSYDKEGSFSIQPSFQSQPDSILDYVADFGPTSVSTKMEARSSSPPNPSSPSRFSPQQEPIREPTVKTTANDSSLPDTDAKTCNFPEAYQHEMEDDQPNEKIPYMSANFRIPENQSDHSPSIEDDARSSEVEDEELITHHPSVILSKTSHGNRIISPSQAENETARFKQHETIRIIGQNCRGAFHKGEQASNHYVPSMESLRGYGADMICLSETNTDWKVNDNYHEAHLLNKAIWNPCPTRTTASSCKWENTNRTNYQVGGVMTLCVNNLVSRIKAVYSDPYGRFTKTSFTGKNKKLISVYNVYRTHPKSLRTAGIDTPWMHQWECLRSKYEECDPRRICIEDLIKEIQKGHENDEFPILFGDFNEDLQDSSTFGIKDLMDTCNLTQIYETKHGTIPSSRSNSRQIYHVFVSKQLEPFVTRLGVLLSEDGFNESDHLPFFVDFKQEMFDFKTCVMPNIKYRKLRTHDALSVEKYNCYVKDQMHHHNVVSRLLNLREYIKYIGFDETAIKELEKLDSTMTQIRIRSEDKLWPDPSRFKHATKMSKLVAKIRLLQSIHRAKKSNRDSTRLEQLFRTYETDVKILNSEKAIATAISENKQELKFLHEEEDIVREDHLDLCYEKAVEIHDTKKASIIKNMKEREKQRRSWEKIRFVTQNQDYRNIDRLGLPAGFENRSTKDIWDYLSDSTREKETDWVFITDSEEIEERLFEWQKLHFGQAQSTPLASKEWHDVLNPVQKPDSEIDAIMVGDIFENSKLPTEAKTFLKELVSNVQPQIAPSQIEITRERFQKFYKKARESTSSSPSGLHLGHWKAAAFDKDVSLVLSTIIQIAVENAYTLTRWVKVVTVLMEKIAAPPRIHKFRTLHLVESDFNFVLRFIWGRVFMRHNEDNDNWNDNQYGGRRAIQGQSAALNKTLTLDTIRYYGEPAAIVDNDAKACYDRIIPVVLSYALIRLGLPKHLTRFMCTWLSKAKYFLKLAPGITEHSYSSTLEEYIFGTGQGTGWSPPNWGAISDIISSAMDKHAPGMFLYHPDGVSFSNRSFDAFVDDVNSGLTSDGIKIFHPQPNSPIPLFQEIYAQIKSNIQYYSRLLYTSGGQLALNKCFAYLLEFKWKNGRKEMIKTSSMYPAIPVDQKFEGSNDYIRLLNPDQPRKMLGCITCPNGDTKAQFEVLLTKARDWGRKIQSRYLTKYDASLSYKQGLSPGLEYPLGVSLLTKKQCEKVMSQAIPALLNKLGFPKSTSREIVHGPYRYGGLEIPHLYASQGVQKLQLLIGHLRKNDKTAVLIRIAIGILQQEVGLSSPVLSEDYSVYHELASKSWSKCLWLFLHDIQGSLEFTDIWVPTKAYSKDVTIMSKVMSWDVPMQTKKKINLCRLHKKVYFVGEIFEASLRRIRPEVQDLSVQSFHNDKFPTIQLPKSFQEIWDNALHTIKADYTIRNNIGHLMSFHCFEFRMSKDFELLFQYRQHVRVGVYIRNNAKENLEFSNNTQNIHQFESIKDAHAASIKRNFNGIKVLSFRTLHKSPLIATNDNILKTYVLDSSEVTSDEERCEFKKYVRSLHPAQQRTIGDIYSDANIRELALALENSSAMGVGDASVKWNKSGHSYIIETKPEQFYLRGVAPVDCSEEAITSNRGEGCTVLAICYIAKILCDMYQIQEGAIEIYCDNMEALRRRPPHLNSYTKMSRRDIDIKMELEKVVADIPLQVSFHHVPGHADEHPDFVYEAAVQQVRRNIDMHNCVTEFMANTPKHLRPLPEAPFYPAQKVALYLRDHIIVDDMIEEVILHEHGSIMEKRMQSKSHINMSIQHAIDWIAFHQAFTKLSFNEKSSTTKIIHQMWPTQSILNDRKRGMASMCLRCKRCEEDYDHVFQCRHQSSVSSFRQAINSFVKQLTKMKTARPIQNALVSILVAYQQCTTPGPPPHALGRPTKLSTALQKVFAHQLLLGTHSLSMGYLSYKWSHLHNMYVKASDPDKCKDESIPNTQWSTKIITALWRFSRTVWQQRCKTVHIKDRNKDESLCVEELRHSIRTYLKLSRRTLSSEEKQLHKNVARHMKKAYPTTLARWLRLLSTERELTIRKKREERIRRGGLQPLTKFFRKKRSP